ncbi:hypothetical protein AaE_000312, partial [Aphanomyces astaci]
MDVSEYVTRLCDGLREGEQASLRTVVHEGGNRLARLRDLQSLAACPVLERHETSGCCGSDEAISCSCIHAKDPPQHIISTTTPTTLTVMLLGRVVASNATLSRNSWPGLYLGDGDVTLPLVLLRPNITWLHQLVCITSWKCIQTRSMAYLEVDSIHRLVTVPIPILPAYMTWQSLLASCYPTHNRPTYAGPYPVQRALSKRTTSKSWSSKKSKSFVVAGRVAAISPVSTQLDSQYFFVEIEAASDPTTGPASPLVRQFISVLMAGHTATFHSFLWPGLEIVLTDLVKVFAKECNMYMLHTTTSAASSSLHYTGQVTRRVCDDSFELNHSVVVLFAHFPLPNRCAGLRVGATVTIFQGHRLGPSLIGLCSRSSVVLDEFASAPTPMHLHPRSSRVQELAFHQVPLTTVAYLLELSQDMLARFS